MLSKETDNENGPIKTLCFKNNTSRNLSLPYSTEIGILIDPLHLRSQRHSPELSFFSLFVFFFFFILVLFCFVLFCFFKLKQG